MIRDDILASARWAHGHSLHQLAPLHLFILPRRILAETGMEATASTKMKKSSVGTEASSCRGQLTVEVLPSRVSRAHLPRARAQQATGQPLRPETAPSRRRKGTDGRSVGGGYLASAFIAVRTSPLPLPLPVGLLPLARDTAIHKNSAMQSACTPLPCPP